MRWASSCGMLGGVSKAGQIELLWQQRGDLMTQRASVLFKIAWISLAIIGVAILVFGLIVTVVPTSSDPPYLRAIGVALIGMGMFGLLITTIAYRRRERWAWFALWYCLMVLPSLLDSAPRRRIAARQRARPPDRVHRTLACGVAPPGARVLPAKRSTGAHDLVVKVPTAAYFRERPTREVRRMRLPRTPVNRGVRRQPGVS